MILVLEREGARVERGCGFGGGGEEIVIASESESGKRYGSGAGESGGEIAYLGFCCCGRLSHELGRGPGACWGGDQIWTRSGGGVSGNGSGSGSGNGNGTRRESETGSGLEAFVFVCM